MAASKLRNDGDAHKHTMEKIWTDAHIQSWAASPSQSFVAVKGTSESTGWLQRLSCDAIDRFAAKSHVLYVVNCATSRDHFRKYHSLDLLRQLAIQGLQGTAYTMSLAFLADIIHRFEIATSTSDWMSILQSVIRAFREVCIIMDLSVFGSRYGDVAHWVDAFCDMLRLSPDNTTTSVKVMFLMNRDHKKSAEYQQRAITISSSTRVLLRSSPYVDVDPGNKLVITEYDLRKAGPLLYCGNQTSQCLLDLQNTTQNHVLDTSSKLPDNPNKGAYSKYRIDDVEVAIVCALPLEANALEPFWDEILDEKEFGIKNGGVCSVTYSIVRIAHHKVAILYMPGMGGFNAAYAVASCQSVFTGLRLAIISGICGGVPFPDKKTEILLGDVIISDGLVNYDFGRQYPERFERKRDVADSARKLPPNISSFLSKLKTRMWHQRLVEKTACHLDEARLGHKYGRSADYPGTKKDVLFESTPLGKPRSTRSEDATNEYESGRLPDISTQQVSRKRLETVSRAEENGEAIHPAIHFGAYGSGNSVMKSANERDRIFQEDKVIAFEMEAVGIWDHYPCIIIKGVCDYADQHKTKDWQNYAAATSAACVKAFLEIWPLGK